LSRLSHRVQKLEESIGSKGKEVGLGEILHWLYRMYGPRLELDEPLPLTPDEQREYEDYQRRCETSKFVLMLAELNARGEADRVAQAQKPTSVDHLIESESVPEPATASIPPAKRANPDPPPASMFEEHRPDGLIKAVPGMRLDVLMALQRNNN
jgi:hypothetical protein